MKKAVKTMLSIALVFTMFFTFATVAFAVHKNPANGWDCTNDKKTATHTGSIGGSEAGVHTWQGMNCSVTVVVYNHNFSCSSCKAYLGSGTVGCEVVHKLCGVHTTGACI